MNLSLRNLDFLMIFVFVLSACQPTPNAPDVSSTTRELVYGLTREPSTFDPHFTRNREVGIVLRQIYDTLIYRDPMTNDFVPGLANSWNISDDGLSYTFYLKPDVLFHDGQSLNSQAVAANLERIVSDDNLMGYARDLLGPYYTGYEILDDRTIRLNLSEPYAPLLNALSQPYLGIASPKALSDYSILRYQFHQVGTGPYVMTDFIPGRYIILERNDDYRWLPVFYDTPSPQMVSTVRFEFHPFSDQRIIDLRDGRIDIIGSLTPNEAIPLTVDASLQLLPVFVPGQPVQLIMNTQRFPTDTKAMRQALLFGTNRDELSNLVFESFAPVAWSPLSGNTLFFDRGLIGAYGYSLSDAQNLIDAVGYDDSDSDGYLDISGVPVQLEVAISSDDLLPEVMVYLREQWDILGIETIVKNAPTPSTMSEILESGEYNLIALRSTDFDPAILEAFYSSDGQYNWTGYQNDDLDEVFEAGLENIDWSVRNSAYVLAQRNIMEEALVLPIVEQVNLVGFAGELEGLRFDSSGWYPLLHNVRWRIVDGS